jgi:hypothetical protein
MSRLRWLGMVAGLLLTSSGCCWWADKMCPQSHYAPPPAAYYPAPAPAPQCCQPCTPYVPTCQPGPSGYPTSWTPQQVRPVANGCTCP